MEKINGANRCMEDELRLFKNGGNPHPIIDHLKQRGVFQDYLFLAVLLEDYTHLAHALPHSLCFFALPRVKIQYNTFSRLYHADLQNHEPIARDTRMLLDDLPAIKKLLTTAKTIAVVGLSPKESRPSNMVARYLIEAGYTVIPVNPGQEEILGLPCYPDLAAVPGPVDIVNIFRRSEDVPPIVAEAIAIGAKAIWLQEGVIHAEAARSAKTAGLVVVMDRCIKTVHYDLGHERG